MDSRLSLSKTRISRASLYGFRFMPDSRCRIVNILAMGLYDLCILCTGRYLITTLLRLTVHFLNPVVFVGWMIGLSDALADQRKYEIHSPEDS